MLFDKLEREALEQKRDYERREEILRAEKRLLNERDQSTLRKKQYERDKMSR